MSDSSLYSGAILIHPPLTAEQIRQCPQDHWGARLDVVETSVPTPTGTVLTRTAARMIPPDGHGRGINAYVQAVIDLFPEHEFTGHIEIDWEAGYGDPRPSRYVIRGRKVVEIQARLIWPGDGSDKDTELHDARDVALLCRDVLAETNPSLPDIFGEAWTMLPDWFTDERRGRRLWRIEDGDN